MGCGRMDNWYHESSGRMNIEKPPKRTARALNSKYWRHQSGVTNRIFLYLDILQVFHPPQKIYMGYGFTVSDRLRK